MAIPSNIVSTIYTQLRKEGHVHRGRIGVSVQTISPAVAEGLSLSRDWGALVESNTGRTSGQGGREGRRYRTDGKWKNDPQRTATGSLHLPFADETENYATGVTGQDQLSMDVPVTDSVDDPQRFADMVNPEDNLVPRLGILAIGIDKNLAAMLPGLRNDYGVVVAAGCGTDPPLEPDCSRET